MNEGVPATIHTDDGHALPVDMQATDDLYEAVETWAGHMRPYFRGSVLAARLGNDIVFVPGDRVSFITIPVSILKNGSES